jgi:putative nucleotidyltransferase with HDIG domain
MPIPKEHADRYVYHTTHLRNLESILSHGILSCNEQPRHACKHFSIATKSIQDRRAQMKVPAGPGGVVHDYIPLYFTKLSPMLLQLVKAKKVDQEYLLHFAFPIKLIEQHNVVFTDAAANSGLKPNFFADSDDLCRLNWPAIDLTTWGSKIESIDYKHERMAEALVHCRLDPTEALFIVVWNDSIIDDVQHIYSRVGLTPPTMRLNGQGENHAFTHIATKVPADMHGKSIACGPILKSHRLAQVLDADAAVATRPTPRFSSLDDLLGALKEKGLAALPETAELIGLEADDSVRRVSADQDIWNEMGVVQIGLEGDKKKHLQDVGYHTMRVVQQLKEIRRFEELSRTDQNLVELAAYLHDIGRGPKSRWANSGGILQEDADHAIRSVEMLLRILYEEVHLDRALSRALCKLVCYHDIVEDVFLNIPKNAEAEFLNFDEHVVSVIGNEHDLDLLIALGLACTHIACIDRGVQRPMKPWVDILRRRALRALGKRS